VVGAAGAAARWSAAAFPLPGPGALFAASVFGRDLVRVVYRYTVVAGALPRARVAQRRNVSPAFGGVAAARRVRAADRCLARAVGGSGQVGLVAGDRRRLAGRCEKGGDK